MWTENWTDKPRFKAIALLVTQRKHRPADYLVFALSTNTMQKQTIGLPEQFLLSYFFFLIALFFVTQKEIGWGFGGKRSHTNLKTGSFYVVKQQYILNLRNV